MYFEHELAPEKQQRCCTGAVVRGAVAVCGAEEEVAYHVASAEPGGAVCASTPTCSRLGSTQNAKPRNKQGTVGDETEVVFVPYEPDYESLLAQHSSARWYAEGNGNVVAHVRVACEHLGSHFDNVVAVGKEVAELLGCACDGECLVSVHYGETGASHFAHVVLAKNDELLVSPVLAANLRLGQQDECDVVLQAVPPDEARRAVAREVTIARISFVPAEAAKGSAMSVETEAWCGAAVAGARTRGAQKTTRAALRATLPASALWLLVMWCQ